MIRFESPLAFLLLALVPLVLWLGGRQRRRGALRFSTVANALRAGQSLRQVFLWVPGMLRALALLLIVAALARPQQGNVQIRDTSRGIAIEMVVDRSGSMRQELSFRGVMQSRLDVVKTVFAEFVHGNGKDLDGRPNDLIGMIAFARYADTVCPLTLGHGALTHFLEQVQIVRRRDEDGTAIGDAVALAAARLRTAEDTLRQQVGSEASYTIKSKVIILLTDGENNCGRRTPEEAAELARSWGIRIYAVGVTGGESAGVVNTPLGTIKLPSFGSRFDTRTLEMLAERSGGRFFLAKDAHGIEEVYREIDRMERSEIESVRHVDYRELFGGFIGAALVLLAVETVLRCTLFRRIP
ncbi:MAG: VWA domain-containing protein [Lentisphaeria bacterium]|nr:VWA domain-containing protein [Lentisphaeria bacterium]